MTSLSIFGIDEIRRTTFRRFSPPFSPSIVFLFRSSGSWKDGSIVLHFALWVVSRWRCMILYSKSFTSLRFERTKGCRNYSFSAKYRPFSPAMLRGCIRVVCRVLTGSSSPRGRKQPSPTKPKIKSKIKSGRVVEILGLFLFVFHHDAINPVSTQSTRSHS